MSKDELDININFKALSEHPVFKNDTVFISLFNPQLEEFKDLSEKDLPSIGFVVTVEEEFKEDKVEQGNIHAKHSYHKILGYLI